MNISVVDGAGDRTSDMTNSASREGSVEKSAPGDSLTVSYDKNSQSVTTRKGLTSILGNSTGKHFNAKSSKP